MLRQSWERPSEALTALTVGTARDLLYLSSSAGPEREQEIIRTFAARVTEQAKRIQSVFGQIFAVTGFETKKVDAQTERHTPLVNLGPGLRQGYEDVGMMAIRLAAVGRNEQNFRDVHARLEGQGPSGGNPVFLGRKDFSSIISDLSEYEGGYVTVNERSAFEQISPTRLRRISPADAFLTHLESDVPSLAAAEATQAVVIDALRDRQCNPAFATAAIAAFGVVRP